MNKKILIFLLLILSTNCIAIDYQNLEFNKDYIFKPNKSLSFKFQNKEDYPVLIKVNQNYEINLEVESSDNSIVVVDTPGHRTVPEFLVLKAHQSVFFVVKPVEISTNDYVINIVKTKLNNSEYFIWLNLYNNLQNYINKDFKKAAQVFKEIAISNKQINPKTPIQYSAYFMAAVSAHDGGLYDKSIEYFDKIINSNERISDDLIASSLNFKARAIAVKGDKLLSISFYKSSAELFLKTNNMNRYAMTLNNIGLSYHVLGNLDEAESYYKQALMIFEKINNSKPIANQFINLGGVYFMRGKNALATELYSKAINKARKINDTSVEANALEMIAWQQQSLGDYAGLLEQWDKILEIRKSLNDQSGITRAYRLIGNSYFSYGNYIKALKYLNKSRELAETVTLTEDYPVTLNKIAQAHYNLNNLELSEKFFLKAKDYNIAVKNDFFTASDYLGLAKYLIKKHQQNKNPNNILMLQNAQNYINKSILIYDKSQNKLNFDNATLVKAEIFYLQKDYSKALEIIQVIKDKAETGGSDEPTLEFDLLYAKILLAKSDKNKAIYVLKKSLLNASRQRQKIINPKYRATYATNLEDTRNLLVHTLLTSKHDNNNVITALIASESGKAKSLNDLVTNNRTLNDKQKNNNTGLQNQLQTLYYLRSDLLDKPHFKKIQLNSINQEIQNVLFKLDVINETNDELPIIQNDNNDRLSQIQNTMNSKSLIIAYRLISGKSYVWHIRKNKIVVKAIPSKKIIEEKIKTFYDFFKKSPYGLKRYPKEIVQVNNWLIDNILFDIDFNKVDKLVISPHGSLQLLPIAALIKDQVKIAATTTISFTPSLLLSKNSTEIKNNYLKILVIADPQFNKSPIKSNNDNIVNLRGSSFESLKFTALEASYIKQIFGEKNVEVLLGKHSTKTQVLSKIENNYDLMHFATHGLIDTDIPEMLGLVFSSNGVIDNNILTIGEIINLSIKSNTVILSACETAIGENIREEGLIGLSYAFLAAGAQQVYATLWKVGDRSALKSIKKMYTNKKDKLNLTIYDPFWVKYEIL